MKDTFVSDILQFIDGHAVVLSGWLQRIRHHGSIAFLDVADSTGHIQVVVEPSLPNFGELIHLAPETALQISGTIREEPRSPQGREIHAQEVLIVGSSTAAFSPLPRESFDVFDPHFLDLMLRQRHIYLRNPKIIAILRFRHHILGSIRSWFDRNRFIDFAAPVLTAMPLYGEEMSIGAAVHGQSLFLTQCVGFYLEAAVHALERVYNIGPSFRQEETRSKRHLIEYWHIKAEMAFGNLDDIITLVESLIASVVEDCRLSCADYAQAVGTEICLDGLQVPYPRLSYRESIAWLQSQGVDVKFGTSLGSAEEEKLATRFTTPFWVVGIPRSIEPFPYVIDPDDPEVTRTADLIATGGDGGLFGVAEKISDLTMLDERLKEKGKFGDERYEWLRDLRQSGCVAHIGFGMGLERFIRWLLQIEHVRDTIPFPRLFGRKSYP